MQLRPTTDESGIPLLVFIDLQPAFLTQLASSRELIEQTNQAMRLASASGVGTVMVRTEHSRDEVTWSLNMRDDGQGFAFEGTADAQLDDRLVVDASTTVMVKRRDSAFFGTPLDALIQATGAKQLFLGGLFASSCIAHTARDAYERDLRVTLLTDCIADMSSQRRDETLAELTREFRFSLRSARDLAQGLQPLPVPTLIGHAQPTREEE